MRIRFYIVHLLAFLLLSVAIQAQPPIVTYQGKLNDNSLPASGTYHMQFSLFDAVMAGNQIGSTITNSSVSVANGIFTVELDFSPATPFASGDKRYLEIAVKLPAAPGFTTLTPRQQVTSAPYSNRTESASVADSVSNACVSCLSDAMVSNTLTVGSSGTVNDSALSANVAHLNAAETITGNWINTSNPWADNEVANVLTISAGSTIEDAALPSTVVRTTGATMTGTLNLPPNGLNVGLNQISVSGGNVGIGIGIPAGRLHVGGATGNNSVILPNDAISSLETLDEPGAASNTDGFGSHPLGNTPTEVLSRVITVPTSGYVLAIASSQIVFQHISGANASIANFGVSKNSKLAFPDAQDVRYEMALNAATGVYYVPVTVHSLFPVTAGAHQFYFLGQELSATPFNAEDVQLTLLFVPTSYGTVIDPGLSRPDASNRDVPRSISRAEQNPTRAEIVQLRNQIKDQQGVIDGLKEHVCGQNSKLSLCKK